VRTSRRWTDDRVVPSAGATRETTAYLKQSWREEICHIHQPDVRDVRIELSRVLDTNCL